MAKIIQLIDSVTWIDMAKNTAIIGIRDNYTADMCISMAKEDIKNLSEKQIGYALKIIYKFYIAGYSFNDTIKKLIESGRSDFDNLKKVQVKTLSAEKYF